MKITKAEVFTTTFNRMPDDAPPKNNRVVGCRLYTDEGIYGDGEVAGIHATYGAMGLIKDMVPRIIGMDPADNEVIFDHLMLHTFWGQNGGAFWYAAVSAIDIALWDIKSKAANIPIYKFLGGKRRDKIRAYASQLQFGWGSFDTPAKKPEDFAAYARKAVKEGYDAVKVDFFALDENGNPFTDLERFGLLSARYVDMFVGRVAAVREAVGPYVDLIIENHAGTNSQSAIQLADAVEKYNIFFFEEPGTPTPYNNRYIKNNISIPIAHGERIYGRWEYLPYFNDGSIQVIQPDLGNCGGLTETKKLCDLAYLFDVGVQIHTCSTHLLTPPSIMLEASIPNFVIHEQHMRSMNQGNMALTTKTFFPNNGYFDVPDGPGLGIEWSEKALSVPEKYVIE